VEIAHSARKHGIADEDMHHAVRNPIRLIGGDRRVLVLGPDRSGRLLEVVVLDDDSDDEPVIIHAMPARPKFLPYLR